MWKQKKYACMIGRFNPLQLGHEFVIDKMIFDFGLDNCLLIVGSKQKARTEDNIFSFTERCDFILKVFPGLNIVWLDDLDSDDEWFLELKKVFELDFVVPIEKVLFYGGSDEDLWYLRKFGLKYIKIDRTVWSFAEISATKVRQKLFLWEKLDWFVNKNLVFDIEKQFCKVRKELKFF